MARLRLDTPRPQNRSRTARQSGQATLEWIGVLVIVAVMITFVVKLGIGSTVARRVKREVCTIFSQKGCGAGTTTLAGGTTTGPGATLPGTGVSTTVGTGGRGGGTHTGPVIGSGQAVPSLPFGTASVKVCSPKASSGGDDTGGDDTGGDDTGGDDTGGDDTGGDGDGDGGGTAETSLQVCDTITDSHTSPTLTAQCTETEQLSISSNLALIGTGSAKGGEAGGSVSGSAGQIATYQLNVTPGQVAAIKAGTGEPNPLDPSSIPKGDSIVLNQESYNQLDLSGSYRSLNASLRYQQGHQISSGIKALGNGEVQVDVGDSDLVQNSMSVGIGTADLGASVSATQRASSGKEYEVDINTNTPGGWATYQTFLHQGTLPTASDAGVSSPATAQVLTETQQVSAEAHAFGVSVGVNGTPNGFSDIETKGADGSESNDFQYQLNNITEVIDTTGTAGASSTTGYQLLLHGVDPQELTGYEQVGGGSDHPSGGDQNVELSFTPAQLEQLQTDADARIAYFDKNDNSGPTTVAGVKAALAKNPYASLSGENGPGYLNQALATAQGPIGILDQLQAGALGNPDALLDKLSETLSAARLTHPETLPLKPSPAGIRDCGTAS